MSGTAQKVPHRTLITLCVMMGNLMQSLDASIANVSLPYMQGTLSTSADEITWVLTSYVIAAAIMTAPVGWMAVRFGRKNLHVACMAGFVVASMLCGMADTLEQMVAFRFLQGVCGAALVPLSQATMLDIYPFERRAQAMAIFGMGVMVGPITGPTLGGYLTEMYNWRYVFYVNLPFGVLAVTGLLIFLPKAAASDRTEVRLDRFRRARDGRGRAAAHARPRAERWTGSPRARSSSRRCWRVSACTCSSCTCSPPERPFLPPGSVQGPQLRLRRVDGVLHRHGDAGEFRADGAVSGEPGRLSGGDRGTVDGAARHRHHHRHAVGEPAVQSGRSSQADGVGLLTLGFALHSMSDWTPDVSQHQMILTFIMQGFAIGFVFNPMTVMAFTTLPPALRGYATSLQSLCRNLGQAVGVSVTSLMLVRSTQTSHADIAAGITPFDRALQGNDSVSHMLDPATRHGAAMLDQMINHQAQIIAFNNDFRLMTFVVVPPLLLLLLMRKHERRPVATPSPAAGD